MGKSKRKTKQSTIIIIIIFGLGIILLSYFTINNYLKCTKYIEKNKTLNVKLNEVKEKNIKTKESNNELRKQKEELENLDEKIANTKTEVFKLASQVETKIKNKETSYKIAYLTFDDGPYHLTDTVIATLKKYKVKATFFTIGLNKDVCFDNRNYSCAETYKKIVDNGHTIANHTYSHLIFNGLYNSTDSFITQVKKQEELIKNRTGVTTNILRFPGGASTAAYYGVKNGAIAKLKEMGYGWVDWTAQDGDGGSLTDYNTGWRNFTNSINENIEVVLFHDYNTTTASLLPKAIEYLENSNYILLPLFYDSVMINK